MNENAFSNISEILTAFQNFLIIYENPVWPKSVTVEEIKTAFKLGNFIEKTIINFKDKQYLDQFMKLLKVYTKQKNLRTYNIDFYEVANNQILDKFFKFPNIEETTLDIGVRVYTSIYPKERFTSFLKTLILTSSSLTVIADFINSTISDPAIIENSIILNRWGDYYTRGQKDSLKSEIEAYLSLYKVELMLPRVLSLLTLKDMRESTKSVQGIILESLLGKMLDRSLLSKTFWLTLFKNVKLHDTAEVCSTYPQFLESLINFIEYIGTMMYKDCESNLSEWNSDPYLCFCSEITYFEVLKMLKMVCRDNVTKEYVFNRLDKAVEHSKSTLWKELKNDISEYE